MQNVKTLAKKIAQKFGRNHDEKMDIEGRCLELAWKEEQSHVDTSWLAVRMAQEATDYLRTVNLRHHKEGVALQEAVGVKDSTDYEEFCLTALDGSNKLQYIYDHLSVRQKELLRLVLEGHEAADIAAIQGKKPNTIRNQIHRDRPVWLNLMKRYEEQNRQPNT